MSQLWTRRRFLQTSSLVLVGGIFVPKFERWFHRFHPKLDDLTWPAAGQFGPGTLTVQVAGQELVMGADYMIVDLSQGVIMVKPKLNQEEEPEITASYSPSPGFNVLNERLGFRSKRYHRYYQLAFRSKH